MCRFRGVVRGTAFVLVFDTPIEVAPQRGGDDDVCRFSDVLSVSDFNAVLPESKTTQPRY